MDSLEKNEISKLRRKVLNVVERYVEDQKLSFPVHEVSAMSAGRTSWQQRKCSAVNDKAVQLIITRQQPSVSISTKSLCGNTRYTSTASSNQSWSTHIVHITLSRSTHALCVRFKTPLVSGCGTKSSISSIYSFLLCCCCRCCSSWHVLLTSTPTPS